MTNVRAHTRAIVSRSQHEPRDTVGVGFPSPGRARTHVETTSVATAPKRYPPYRAHDAPDTCTRCVRERCIPSSSPHYSTQRARAGGARRGVRSAESMGRRRVGETVDVVGAPVVGAPGERVGRAAARREVGGTIAETPAGVGRHRGCASGHRPSPRALPRLHTEARSDSSSRFIGLVSQGGHDVASNDVASRSAVARPIYAGTVGEHAIRGSRLPRPRPRHRDALRHGPAIRAASSTPLSETRTSGDETPMSPLGPSDRTRVTPHSHKEIAWPRR
jgi:hypothetical protein